ncbi:hypothetical protein ACULMA_17340 [Xanthomonas arboricola pv. corylina]|uniref:hypothetical protein n=1 Tax=Xanthomonas arboricola TaxID=56448 RepID=UPI00404092D4
MSGWNLKWGGGYRQPSMVRLRWGGGWINPAAVRLRWGGGWVTIYTAYTPISGSASGSTAQYNNGNSRSPMSRQLSARATAYGTNGNGNYSYSWSVVSTSGVSNVTIGAAGNYCDVSVTATLNNYGSVTVQCVISDGQSSTTVQATTSYNYYNTV